MGIVSLLADRAAAGCGVMRRFAGALGLLAALAAMPAQALTVGSKDDTEGALLGNVIALVLEAAGLPVTLRLKLGGTDRLRAALLAGDVDIYPEYTGNGALFFKREGDPAWFDAAAGHALAAALDGANGLVWLAPAPANNAWAIAVHRDLADGARVRTLEDFARHVGAGGRIKLAASREFVDSPAALPAFQSAYGFRLAPDQIALAEGGDTAVTMMMAWEQRDGVNAAMVYGTDGLLPTVNLLVLEDPRHAQPVFAPAPVVRAAVLDRHPKLREALQAPFAALTTDVLQRLNSEIAVNGDEPRKVARDWLASKGFLSR